MVRHFGSAFPKYSFLQGISSYLLYRMPRPASQIKKSREKKKGTEVFIKILEFCSFHFFIRNVHVDLEISLYLLHRRYIVSIKLVLAAHFGAAFKMMPLYQHDLKIGAIDRVPRSFIEIIRARQCTSEQ